MFGKMISFIFYLTILCGTHGYAGWPEDGWEGVHSLNIGYKGKTIDFDGLHQLLAAEEEKVARLLPSNNSTNIVLASISFLGGGGASLQTYYLQSPDNKWLVFESGWDSSFISNPIYDEAQRLMRPYAAKLQKEEGLPLPEKQQLVQDCIKVAHGQCYFEEQIRPHFQFFDHEPIPVDHIMARAERAFSEMDPSEAGADVWKELMKNKAAFTRVASILQTTKLEAGQNISALCEKIDLASGVSLDFVKELAAVTKSSQEKLAKQEREMSNIGSKVISTYWHSEPKLLKYIEESTPSILEDIFKRPLLFKPEAVFINIHSRHDICPVCSHTFVRSYTHPEGILKAFRAALCEKLAIDSKDLPLYITSSFREKREKTKYSVNAEQSEILENPAIKVYPAFPTLHVPISTHEFKYQ